MVNSAKNPKIRLSAKTGNGTSPARNYAQNELLKSTGKWAVKWRKRQHIILTGINLQCARKEGILPNRS